MIKQHIDSTFEAISDETILWQYMPLAKFLFLIKNKKLHLHRLDDYSDKDEGVLSVLDKKSLPFFSETNEMAQYFENDRKRTFVSCWIQHPTEQSLMWYAYGTDGVAIRTTVGSLKRAFAGETEHDLYLMRVKYIDKEKQATHQPGDIINFFRFYTTKRQFFELENEVRLIYVDKDKKYIDKKGIDVDVVLHNLVEEIIVSPTAPRYVYDLICQEVKEAGISVTPMLSVI